MKSSIICYYVFCISILLFIPYRVTAQSDEFGSLINAGATDANTLAKAYLTPMLKGFGTGLNTGWIHTGTPKDFPDFYIGVQSGLSFVPSSEHRFDVTNMIFENLNYQDGPTTAPTVNGPQRDGPHMLIIKNFNGTGIPIDDFTLPQGTGLNFAPAPVIQAGVGLAYNTSLMIRLVPKIKVNDYSGYMTGFGVQHGLNQWIPGGLDLPVDLSFMMGYTLIRGRVNLDITPEYGPGTTNPYSLDTWNNQYLRSRSTAFTLNFIAGKKFSVLNLFGGLGYETSQTSIKTIGNYPTLMPDPQPNNPYHTKIDMLTDPINFSVKGFQTVHLLAGFAVDLGLFQFFTDYTLSKYSTLSAGFAFGM